MIWFEVASLAENAGDSVQHEINGGVSNMICNHLVSTCITRLVWDIYEVLVSFLYEVLERPVDSVSKSDTNFIWKGMMLVINCSLSAK